MTEEERSNSGEETEKPVLYGVDDVPPAHLTILFGLQQAVMCIGGSLSLPYILATLLCPMDEHNVRAQLLSIAMFMCGVATVLQCFFGVRLPIIQGGSHTFVAPVVAMMTLERFRCPEKGFDISPGNGTNIDWTDRMREIQGNLILASMTQVFVGSFGLIGVILRFVGPLTIAPTVSLIGLSLSHVVAMFCETHWGISMLTLFFLLLFSTCINKVEVPIPSFSLQRKCHTKRLPVFQLFPVVISVAIVWSLSHVLTVTDVFPSNSTVTGHKARTDSKLEIMTDSPWFTFPLPFQFGRPTFSLAGYMGMMAATISSIIESVGDYFAAARLSGAPLPPAHAINRGITFEGMSSIISGLVGAGHATTSYSGNIGIIGITKVASRTVFIAAGVILIICGLVGKVGAALALIPEPIIGATLALSLGMVASIGISVLQFCDMSSSRNITILGVSFLMGLMVPEWLAENSQKVKTGSDELDQMIRVLFGTASFVGGFIGFVLDAIIPGSKHERGIDRWVKMSDQSTSEHSTLVSGVYDLPFVTKYIKRVRACQYFPISPSFVNCGTSCLRTSHEETDGCKLTEENGLLPLQKEV
ncbi:solute carrier family 23 member 2-like [Ostrea edulis]|uniref:solute carrier family 23 member 2-like n=1 Tax=Ostrea edulis TaxID=37623 RepID=UPI0024AFB52A|nr:solute carrier family 23 member 2-like [Ostrea edulis]